MHSGIDPTEFIGFYGLRSWATLDRPRTTVVYVHSKMMIVDDRIAIIGSGTRPFRVRSRIPMWTHELRSASRIWHSKHQRPQHGRHARLGDRRPDRGHGHGRDEHGRRAVAGRQVCARAAAVRHGDEAGGRAGASRIGQTRACVDVCRKFPTLTRKTHFVSAVCKYWSLKRIERRCVGVRSLDEKRVYGPDTDGLSPCPQTAERR